MPDYQFVDRPNSIVDQLHDHDRLAVDTEFMREKTFFAQLCLVQIATPDDIFCVDPLSNSAQDLFWKRVLGASWVVHSARQDIEVVLQTAGTMPSEVFDTQIAAGLLGMPAQIGYAGLVKDLLDVDMSKSHTRADWTRRPLPEAVLQYAAEDVEHLLPIASILSERLDKKKRLDWALEDSKRLLDPALYDTGSDQAIGRLKGARNFRGRRRAAAVRLAAWREEEAIRRNRPRQWIVRDGLLLDIAHQLPASVDDLAKVDGMPSKLLHRVGRQLIDEVAAADDQQDNYQPPRPPGEAQKALLKEMQSLVAECAGDLELAAETVASKRELAAAIVTGERNSRVFSTWRRELVGEKLLQLL